MNSATYSFDLFNNAPLMERWKRSGLVSCIGIIILFTWIPLVAFSSIHRSESFLIDISVHLRFLLALPLLIVAPLTIKNKLRDLIFHFVESNIIKDSEKETFLSYIESTKSLRDSRVSKTIIWLFVYIVIIYIKTKIIPSPDSSYWMITSSGGETSLSYAGLWFTFVSQPIFTFIQLYLIYRVLLWWRLLYLISKLDLQLKASHGDDTGGLIFLGGSIRIFYFPVLALSSAVATGAMNMILNKNINLYDIKLSLIVYVISCVLLFVGPLLLFYRSLVKVKFESIRSYGAFAGYQLEVFEKKWLYQKKENLDPELMDSSEFSSVTDANSIVNRVYQMRLLPFTHMTFIGFILCALIPFLPVMALEMPWGDIFKKLFKLVL